MARISRPTWRRDGWRSWQELRPRSFCSGYPSSTSHWRIRTPNPRKKRKMLRSTSRASPALARPSPSRHSQEENETSGYSYPPWLWSFSFISSFPLLQCLPQLEHLFGCNFFGGFFSSWEVTSCSHISLSFQPMKFLTVVVVVVVGGYSIIQKKKTGRNRTIHWLIHHCCSLCFLRDCFCSPTFDLCFNVSSMCSLSSCKLIPSKFLSFLGESRTWVGEGMYAEAIAGFLWVPREPWQCCNDPWFTSPW